MSENKRHADIKDERSYHQVRKEGIKTLRQNTIS